MHHQREEIKDQVGRLAQNVERQVAEGTELSCLDGIDAAHALHHLGAQLHGGREELRVVAKDVPKVDVNQLSVRGQQQVVQVAVTDAQQVRDDTKSS